MRTSDRHDLLRRRSFGICRQAKWGMTSEAKSTRVSTSFRSPLISRSMPAPRYCRIRSICWMPDMQTKFVEADGLRFEVLEQGTGVRLALCLHGFPEYAISWRHQIPVLAGMGWSLTRAAGCLRLPVLKTRGIERAPRDHSPTGDRREKTNQSLRAPCGRAGSVGRTRVSGCTRRGSVVGLWRFLPSRVAVEAVG